MEDDQDQIPVVPGATDGTQQPEAPAAKIPTGTYLAPLSQQIVGLASAEPDSFGGPIAAGMLIGATHQLSLELQSVKRELGRVRQELTNCKGELEQIRIENVRLSERLRVAVGDAKIKTFAAFFGTTLLALAIEAYRDHLETWAAIMSILGAAALVFSFFSRKGGQQ